MASSYSVETRFIHDYANGTLNDRVSCKLFMVHATLIKDGDSRVKTVQRIIWQLTKKCVDLLLLIHAK